MITIYHRDFYNKAILLVEAEALSGIDLSGERLSFALINNVNMHGSLFVKTDLSNAHLSHNDMSMCNFNGANLSGATLSFSKINNSTLIDSNINNSKSIQCEFIDSDLSNASMLNVSANGTDFTGSNLSSAKLTSASLYSASFTSAIVRCADFSYARMGGFHDQSGYTVQPATVHRANLCNSYIRLADIRGIDFREANLANAVIDRAFCDFNTIWPSPLSADSYDVIVLEGGLVLEAFDFTGTDLLAANFCNSNLRFSIMRGVLLTRSRFDHTELTEVNFENAHLTYASFEYANLTKAILKDASVSGANFYSANVCGADMRFRVSSSLKRRISVNLENCKYNNSTMWNDNFNPREYGAVKITKGS